MKAATGSSIDPALLTGALAALEAAVNGALQLAPGADSALAVLDGSVFALQCKAPELEAFLRIENGRPQLLGRYDGPVTSRVIGNASDFAQLATTSDPAAALINGEFELQGDSAPLIELQKIISTLQVDWEAPLVSSLGDVVGHQLAELLRSAFSWSRQAASSLNRQLSEFIHEEARLSPPPLELEDFYRDVQDLGLRTERLESRTARLRKRIQTLRA